MGKRSCLAPKRKKRENKELNHLPLQKPEEICLYRTDPEKLTKVEQVDAFHDGLVKLKLKFLWEIQDWSKRFGIDADMRVYFELKPGG
jgi:hypothetical protein